jgi:hypothetical protein
MMTEQTQAHRPATTLGQIVFIRQGVSKATQDEWDEIYHTFQRADLFTGLHKEHEPFEETDPATGHQINLKQPTQEKRIQADAQELLLRAQKALTRRFDVTATQDTANTLARADVIVGDRTMLRDVPVSHLLWLEGEFTHMLTVFGAIPTRSLAEDWKEDTSLPLGRRRTDAEIVPSTRKVTEFRVIVPATDKFPAQVSPPIASDVHSGNYRTIKYTAALPIAKKNLLTDRVVELLEAVKQAVVRANHQHINDVHEGEIIFNYLLDGVLETQ